MMDLYHLLNDTNARITLGNRWLVYNIDEGWTVYEAKPYAKKSKIIIQTDIEEDAIGALTRED